MLRSLTRHAGGRITGYTHTNSGGAQSGLDQGFAYDNLDRLVSAASGGSATAYTYDESGNRMSKTVGTLVLAGGAVHAAPSDCQGMTFNDEA
ncbi:hypothetical protein [Ramlibacter humi]|uniref:hypothetical protein n=1 Tax=Ramlibacter humi TaxID=2530451 RepID=UPI001431D4AC|nr:hypothetical protein [Ramlibacter humi]